MKDFLKGKRVALIDMDGVIFDSMKYHAAAWEQVMAELGIEYSREDVYQYEGMTGTAIINILFQRALGHGVSDEYARELYNKKSEIFRQIGTIDPMPGSDRMLKALKERGIRCIVVTGSAQKALLNSIDTHYPGIFQPGDRITAHDVTHGKPDPEPYLKGLTLSGVKPEEAFVIENAPLGVKAGKAAGLFTIAVTTGPIPRPLFEEQGADVIFGSMPEFADTLTNLNKEE